MDKFLEEYLKRNGGSAAAQNTSSKQTDTKGKEDPFLEAYLQRQSYAKEGGQGFERRFANTFNATQDLKQQSGYGPNGNMSEREFWEALQGVNPAKGTSRLLGGVFDNAKGRVSSVGELGKSPYKEYLKREDYKQKSQAAGSKKGLFGDALYDYINNINGEREKQDIEARAGNGSNYGKYAFMTEDEIGVYNYLYATEGKKAAKRFLKSIDAELNQQWFSGASKNMANEATKNGFNKALYSLGTVAGQPIRMGTSALAWMQDFGRVMSDREIDPYSPMRQASQMTQSVRNAIAEDPGLVSGMSTAELMRAADEYALAHGTDADNPFIKAFTEESEEKNAADAFLYQTVMSAADSAVNMWMAQGLAQGITGLRGIDIGTEAGLKTLQKATNFIGAFTMSNEVMSLGVAEAKQKINPATGKQYSDLGALGIGLLRGAVEFASEAIGGDWAVKMINKDPLNFTKTMLRVMIPEGVEEVMSDVANGIFNLIIDAAFGTQESGIPQLYDYYVKQGSQNPWWDVIKELLGEEALSFLGGALATFGTSSAQTYNVQQGIRATANRMNTTPEAVVQLMNDYQTENPGDIYTLSQRFNAEDVESFRAAAGEGKTAANLLEEQHLKDKAEAGTIAGKIRQGFRGVGHNLTDAEVKILADGFETGDADEGTYLSAIHSAYNLGKSGNFTLQEAIRASSYAGKINETQFRHAFELGASQALTDIDTVDVNTEEGQEKLAASLSSLGNYAGEAAAAYEAGQDVNTYAEAMYKAASLYVANGKDLDAVVADARSGKTSNIVGRLTDAQIQVAKAIGEKMRAANQEQVQKASQQRAAAREANTTGEKRVGNISIATESGSIEGMKYNAVDESKLNKSQKNVMRFADTVAKVLGLDITVVSGEGTFGGAYSGNGKIYLNINSGMNLRTYSKVIAAASLGHEIVHSLKDRAEAEYEVLKQRVIDSMSADKLEELVQEQLRTQPNLTYDGAVDEVVANACQTLLQNSEALKQLARESMTTAEKIQDVIHEFVEKIHAAFAEVDYHDNLPIFRAVQAVEKSLDQIQKDFDNALIAAKRNADAEVGGNKKAASEGGTVFQIQADTDLEETNIEDGRAAIEKLMSEAETSDDPESLVVENAMYRSDLGPIDFKWGTPGRGNNFKGGYGLSHIIAKRNAENGRGVEIANRIVEAIAKAKTTDTQFSDNLSNDHYRIRLYYEDITAVLNKDPGENHWLLTGWENNETAPSATGEVHDSAGATAATTTRTRRSGDAAVSDNRVAQNGEEVKNGEKKTYYQLIDVDPVQPSSDAWSRTATTEEAMQAYPNLWNVAAEESETNNPTQRASTVSTYRNIYNILKKDGFSGKILDASSGMGFGTQLGRSKEFGFDVDDIEPYPGQNYKPKYTDYSKLNEKYDAIISSAVLNVLPQDQRDALVVKMGELLNPGGKMYITTRGTKGDVDNLAKTGKNIQLGPSEYIETVHNHYQKGFTNEELQAYLQDALGDDFVVEIARGKDKFNNNTAVIVTKKAAEQTAPTQLQVWDMTDDDTAAERRGRQSAYARLQSENAILKQTVKELKRTVGKQKTTLANIQKQLQLTKTPQTRLSDARKLAKAIIAETGSKAADGNVAAAIKQLGDYILNTQADQLSEEELKGRARAIAREVLDSATETMTLEGETMHVNPYDAYMGEATEDLANRIVMDAMNGVLRPTAPTKADKQQARTQALKDRIQELIQENKLQQREGASLYQTIYDLSLQLDRAQSRYETLRQNANRRVAEVRAEGAARAAEVKASERARAEGLLEEQKQHYLDIAKRARERRENAVSVRTYRSRIMKLYKDFVRQIQHPTEAKHIPPQLMQQAAAILSALNMDNSREGSKAGQKLKEKLATLKATYDGIQKDPDFRAAAAYDPIVSEMMQTMIDQVGDTPINQMSVQQLEIVYNVLKAMQVTAKNAMKIQLGNEERDAYQASVQMTNETRSSPNKAGTGLFARWLNSQLSPERMFNRLGGNHKNSMWSKVYQMLNGGQLKSTQIFVEGSRIFDKLMGGRDYDAFVNPKNAVDIGLKDENGNTVYLTHGMMVSLYMHLMNEDNTRHAILGGVEVPALKDYYNGKKTRGTERAVRVGGLSLEAVRQIDELREQLKNTEDPNEQRQIQDEINDATEEALAYADELRSQIEGKLTEYDRQWISALKTLFDSFSKDQINATTMDVYGIKKAGVDNYYPIWVDGDFLNTPFESIARDFSIENVGFLKERVTSNKPIRLADASEVAASQLKKVAQYCGLMPVIRDFNKIWGKTQRSYSDSLKKAVHSVFGETGVQYIDNLMADLNGARGGNDGFGGEIFNRLRGHMAQAALTLSMRTAFGQTASYPTAASVVGWGPLLKALARGGKNNTVISRADQALIEKYSPLLAYRMKGYSSIELGDIASSNSRESRLWKKMRWLTGWIQAMDGATVGRLWYAAEYYVQDHNKDLEKGTDAYYQEVAKVFNDIVEKTQPDYTTMQRPDILRNPNALVRSLTMFMTQRLQNFNIVFDAAANLTQAKKDYAAGRFDVTKEDVHQAAVDSRRAVVSQLVAGATIVAFKFLADAILHSMNAYRDDDKELTEESVSLQLLNMFLDSVVGNFLWGGELYDLVESRVFGKTYYGIEVSSVSTVTDMVTSFNNLVTEMLENGIDGEKFGSRLNAFAKDLSSVLGIPLANAEKIILGVVYHAQDIANGEFGSFDAGVSWLSKTKAATWKEKLEPLGITQRQFSSMLDEANADGNSNLSQDEVGAWLTQELANGNITEEQAKAYWAAAGNDWKKTFDEWRSKPAPKTAPAPATAAAPATTPAPAAEVTTYDQFAKEAPLYDSKKQSAYDAWANSLQNSGMSLDEFTQFLRNADASGDGNGSIRQDEMGYALYDKMQKGELTFEEADAVWRSQWNNKRSTYFEKWLRKNGLKK